MSGDRRIRPWGRFAAVLSMSLSLFLVIWAVPPAGAAEKTRVVVDHTGKEVRIPARIERIVITGPWPLPSVYCLFEGAGTPSITF